MLSNSKFCYICLDNSGNLLENICECKTLYVHKRCLFKFIDINKGKNKCTICKKKYKIKNNQYLTCCIEILNFIAFSFYVIFIIIFLQLIGNIIYFFKNKNPNNNYNLNMSIIYTIGTFLLCIIFLFLYNYCKYNVMYTLF